MKKEQEFRFRTELLLSVVCLIVFSGCSSVEGIHQANANLVAKDQADQKVENARVDPGQPYNMGFCKRLLPACGN